MHRTPSVRALLWGATLLALGATSVAQSVNAEGQFARAKAQAAVRNFADAAGSELVRLDAGHPLRVFGTSEGTPRFHEVEVAGGVPVWVYGELLQPTTADGVLRVDASGVNMRPFPESTPRSMALRTKLGNGDRVLLIQRNDPSKPLAQDWVKVWSPEATRVWIDVADVELVPAGDAAGAAAVQSAWAAAARRVPTPKQVETQRNREREREAAERVEALPPIPVVPQEAIRGVTEADLAFDALLARPEATAAEWGQVVELYRAVQSLAPEGTGTYLRSTERLSNAEARQKVAQLRETIQAEDERRRAELAEIVAERERAELSRSTLMGRFQGRGFLYSRVLAGERRWYLEFTGETVAEVRCTSGRYDLATFEGFELGVSATTVNPAMAATATSPALPKVLDIMRIEVLSGSGQRR